MTTHRDTDDRPDVPSCSQVLGEILANLGDAATSALPEPYKTAADVLLTVLPYAGDIWCIRPLRRCAAADA